jgi:hypothetical protein
MKDAMLEARWAKAEFPSIKKSEESGMAIPDYRNLCRPFFHCKCSSPWFLSFKVRGELPYYVREMLFLWR